MYIYLVYIVQVCIYICVYIFVQSLSYIRLFVTPWTVACQVSPYFTVSQVCSNSCPLSQWCQATISSSVAPFSSCPQSSTASGSFSKGRFLLRRWPKYQSFSFSISPFNAYSGLMSFRSDWFELPAVQGTLKDSSSGPQFKNINSSARTFLMMQITSIYDHWKNHSLD